MSEPTSSRPRGSRLGLALFLVLLALISLEVAGRAAGFQRTPLRVLRAAWAVAGGGSLPSAPVPKPTPEELAKNAYRPLPYVMYGLKPSWNREGQKQPDGTLLTKTSNAFGFRGREIEMPKPQGRTRIVCLGGSTTYSDTVSDDATYPLLLEQELRKARPGRDIEVINAGVPSYTTAETLPNLAFRCLDLQPDIIVLYEGINDYRPRVYRNFDNAYFHYRKVWNGTVDDWEAGEGEVGGGINAFIQHDTPKPNGDKLDNVKRAGTGAFRRNLTSIAGVAKAHGVKVVFVTCTFDPDNQHSDAVLRTGISEHNQVVREVAEAQGAAFIDMAAAFRTKDQFADPIHMNPAGSAQMARLIADGMLKGSL